MTHHRRRENQSAPPGGLWRRSWQRWCDAHRASRGFSLTELVVTMVLSTVIAIGAFHIHATFQSSLHRQDEISRIQGTMKVTRAVLERKIRPAGAGLVGLASSDCGGTHPVGPFIFHNNNTIGTADTVTGGTDNDPDWFEVLAANMTNSGIVQVIQAVQGDSKQVDNGLRFTVDSLIGLRNANGVCVYMASRLLAGAVGYQTNNTLQTCYNSQANTANCANNILQTANLSIGDQVIDLSRSFSLRIDNSRPDRPVLMMANGVAGGDPNQYTPRWTPVAVNVEDMQVALHLDTTVPPDGMGDIWINSRDLTNAELMSVRAIRLSLVFRSNNEVPGWRAGRRPALEDRPIATTTDGYIRRVMTTVIKLRNRPEPRPGP